MKEFNTLWSILKEYGIQIPPIQRDYAQGRKTNEADKIRKKFLDSIFEALTNKQNLSLDFVYGKIYGLKNEEEHKRNKNAIQMLINSVKDYALTVDLTLQNIIVEDKSSDNLSDIIYLVPLDGQQRLTTLFLLHWYIVMRLSLNNEKQFLRRFKYKTRKSSSAFLKLITSEELKLNFKKEKKDSTKNLEEQRLYNEITNLEFFSTTWLFDPTVKSMLIVIQEIHNRMESYNSEMLESCWNNLTSLNLLTFDFLDLEDFNLTDELYVKMNARGKQLSTFENFKAWLYGLIDEKGIINRCKWEGYLKKFDIGWNDIFWNQKDLNVFDIDDAYFNFFKRLYLYDAVKEIGLNGTSFDRETSEIEIINSVIDDKEFDWEYLCKDLFENKVEKYLEYLEYCEDFNPENKYLKDYFKFKFSVYEVKLNWQNLIKNYITYSFIVTKDKRLNLYCAEELNTLSEYHRILFNLFDNTVIDNQSLYQNALIEIDQFNKDLKNKNYLISEWIEDLEHSTKSVFTKSQINEEILKYRLFRNEDWKRSIQKAEEVEYFERQLNFWFYRSNISMEKQDFNEDLIEDTVKRSQFDETTEKMNLLFEKKKLNRSDNFSDYIFERALLSKCDYLLIEKKYKCFGRNSGRDVSWKRLFFRDRNSETTNQALLEIFNLDFKNAKQTFVEYIDENCKDVNLEKWRKVFCENSKLFDYLGELRYIRNIDKHGWVIIKDSYKTYIGAHYELFSLYLKIRYLNKINFPPFTSPQYHVAPKNDYEDFPYTYLEWKTMGANYTLRIKFIKGVYELHFVNSEGLIPEDVNSMLISLGFLSSKIETVQENNVVDKIRELASSLSKVENI